MLTPLFRHGSVRWFSLQVGPAARQIAAHGWSDRILDVSPLLNDFAETAGALTKMDLLITVDTSAAHLAGTLQAPVWVMLPFVPDWRWLLKRGDSPWYPSLRLFRQPTRGDWGNVVEEVVAELAKRFPISSSS
jgi:ADP-heptose:LPS heptosyltransferase